MNIRFLAVARQELDDAFVWYERQAPGLGYEFLDEVDRTVHRIRLFPDSGTELAPGVRRALTNRFPYSLTYGQDAEAMVVLAVAHLHREPRYWMSRLAQVRRME
jgi:plasmid stabilization system protein ParE